MSVRRAQDERLEGSPDGLNAIVEISDVPDTPGTPSATNVGTSRAYNNGAATVTVTSAATGGTPTSYTVTSSPGSFTGSGTSPVTVTGLASATSYSFTATATNSTGTSPATAASNSITATTVPQNPGTPTASVTNATTVSLAFTPGATGGSAITSYTATSSPSVSLSTSGTTSPVTVTGTFVGDIAYTFTLVANNANGASTASSASNSVTPNPVPKNIYFGRGGQSPAVDKFSVPNDTRSTLAASATTPCDNIGSLSNSGTAGYYAGGLTSGVISTIRKLTYSSDSFSTVSATITQGAINVYAVANSGTAGYFPGGDANSTPRYSSVSKLTFSNDTVSNLGNLLGVGKSSQNGNGAASNNGVAGYIAGGWTGSGSVTQEKLNYSNDTRTGIGNLASQGGALSGLANSGSAGYYGSGYFTSSPNSFIQKVVFSNDTSSLLGNRLTTSGRATGGGASHNGVAGYWAGGRDSAFADLSSVDKMPFSTETASQTTSLGGASSSGPIAVANVGTI